MKPKPDYRIREDALTIKLWDLLGDCAGAWEKFVRQHVSAELADRVLLYRASLSLYEN